MSFRVLLVLSVGILVGCGPRVDTSTGLSGPFLGQGDPPAEPELFAPGIVNTGLATRDVAMTPDGDEIYFGVHVGNFALSAVMVTRLEDGRWTTPEVAPFSADPRYMTIEPHIGPDGRRLYFATDRPHDGDGPPREDHDIWVADRAGDGWGPARPLGPGVNSDRPDFFPSTTRDGWLYFTRDDPGRGPSVVMRARRQADGSYGEAEALPSEVNLGRTRFNAFVDPGHRWIIVPTFGMPDTRGATDYYLVRRGEDDAWGAPINLGDAVNTPDGREYSAYVSPDGRALFFMSPQQDLVDRAPSPLTLDALHRLHGEPGNGLENIWWVDAALLDDLTPSM